MNSASVSSNSSSSSRMLKPKATMESPGKKTRTEAETEKLTMFLPTEHVIDYPWVEEKYLVARCANPCGQNVVEVCKASQFKAGEYGYAVFEAGGNSAGPECYYFMALSVGKTLAIQYADATGYADPGSEFGDRYKLATNMYRIRRNDAGERHRRGALRAPIPLLPRDNPQGAINDAMPELRGKSEFQRVFERDFHPQRWKLIAETVLQLTAGRSVDEVEAPDATSVAHINEKLDQLCKDWEQSLEVVAVVTREESEKADARSVLMALGSELEGEVHAVVDIENTRDTAIVTLGKSGKAGEIISKLGETYKKVTAATQSLGQLGVNMPKYGQGNGATLNAQACGLVIGKLIKKARTPRVPSSQGKGASVSEELKVMRLTLQTILTNQHRMEGMIKRKGQQAATGEVEEVAAGKATKRMGIINIKPDHSCAKHLMIHAQTLLENPKAKLDQTRERAQLAADQVVKNSLRIFDELPGDEEAKNIKFKETYGDGLTEYLDRVLRSPEEGTGSWMGQTEMMTYFATTGIQPAIVLVRERDKDGNPDPGFAKVILPQDPGWVTKTKVVFILWDGSHFNLAWDEETSRVLFDVGEDATDAQEKLVEKLKTKRQLSSKIATIIEAEDRGEAIAQFRKAQAETSLRQRKPRKTKTRANTVQEEECSYYLSGQQCPFEGKCKFKCYPPGQRLGQPNQPRDRGRPGRADPGASADGRAASRSRSRTPRRQRSVSPRQQMGQCNYFRRNEPCPHSLKGDCRFQCYPKQGPRDRGRPRQADPSRKDLRSRSRTPRRLRSESQDSEGFQRVERSQDKLVKAVVVFTSQGRDAVMKQIGQQDKNLFNWIESATEIGSGEDKRVARVILHTRESSMAEVQSRVQEVRDLGYKAAQYEANPRRKAPQESPAEEGLERAKKAARGTCRYRMANSGCPFPRCKFVCYGDGPPEDVPPDLPKRYR